MIHAWKLITETVGSSDSKKTLISQLLQDVAKERSGGVCVRMLHNILETAAGGSKATPTL